MMLVKSFYENVDRDGRNAAMLHFVPRPAGTMLVACVYARWTDPAGGEPLLSFAAITDEPPAEVAAAGHDRMIVNLKPEHVAAVVCYLASTASVGITGQFVRASGTTVGLVAHPRSKGSRTDDHDFGPEAVARMMDELRPDLQPLSGLGEL